MNNPIVVVDYDQQWPEAFALEAIGYMYVGEIEGINRL